MRVESSALVEALMNDHTHIYVCGLRAMESGVEKAFADIARGAGLEWDGLRAAMRKTGRYHVETY
jgi:benzoyl-CoA 2,3-dioxygenase component A